MTKSQWITLKAADGVEISAYEVWPDDPARGGLVVIQEIFGVNGHIRRVADSYAADGYHVIAPAIFDRAEPGFEVGYDDEGRTRGIALMQKVSGTDSMLDIAAAVELLKKEGKVGIIGYCLGGTYAWLAASQLPVDAAVVYYGGGIGRYSDRKPGVPVQGHFGLLDRHIPQSDLDKVRVYPNAELFTYQADHGFNCDERSSYEPASAAQARERALGFLRAQIG
ncbi:carboxymethylenebutenolidase [Labrys miyagiensis]|uniref:Carboxymethylenebutenolidase n=1 Tax=Labrys miyagiensis TaxID=346912 RepID=A0ABQ6CLK0_9HYPH|nr:dienelactone hydrolase family protein [Labrys miyagiensis]GLS21181.1 carboxymethylenebutenolidase [Labrys miyagiensis]